MTRRNPEPAEAQALRLAIAATIAALVKAPTRAEHDALIAERNALGKRLAHLLRAEQVC